uniref:PawS-like protein (-)alb.a n=1 Tax=Dimorphotheca sinuata TaxID=112408 RepID=A0A1V0JB74_DIMSI|nr:PawS-like protein (-)alb.a [Dimorphotheca sinuata]
MTKLALLVLAFATIVALCEVSAYKTTITTTTIEHNSYSGRDRIDSLRVPVEERRTTTTIEDNSYSGRDRIDSLRVPIQILRPRV